MKIKYKYRLVTLLILVGGFTYAQTPGFDDDVQDVTINQWVIPMVLFGMLLAVYSIKKIIYTNK
ncbi:MAG: hypothetical protein RL259_67 [Bacteroidota bacterium]|jgi:hypothetical protein